MNRYIRYALLWGGLVGCMNSCIEDPELSSEVKNAAPPEVKLLTGIEEGYDLQKTATTITLQAEVERANGLPVERYGFCWSLEENPTVEGGDTIVCGSGLGVYEGVARDLQADTTYYIRPYAMNKKGVAYGDGLAVTTNTGIGSVKTLEPWNTTASSAMCGGKMIEWGEGEITQSGVYLYKSTLKDPEPVFIPMEIEAEKDSFFQIIPNLDPSTVYYVKAYVENAFGIFPGGEAIRFATTDGKPYISSFRLMSKDYTSATFRTVLRTKGDSEIIKCGYCYSDSIENPSLEDDGVLNVSCELVDDSVFVGILPDLKQSTVYYVRAYVENSFGLTYNEGDAYELTARSQAPTVTTSEIANADIYAGSIAVRGEIKDKGEGEFLDAGFCWSTNPEPTIANVNGKLSVSGDSLLTGVISGLRGATTYYIRAYAQNSNAISYGETREITTPNIISTLTNYAGEEVTEASVCVLRGVGYVFGGDLGRERSDALWAYNISSDVWEGKSSSKEAVKGATFFQWNFLTLVSFGGKDNQNNVTNAAYYYSLLYTNEWSPVEVTPSPVPLSKASGMMIDNYAYLIGGEAQDSISNKIYRFNNDVWEQVGDFPEKQFGAVSVIINDVVYAGLGQTGNGISGASYSKRLWASDDKMQTWEALADCPTEANGIIRGVECDGQLFVLDTNLEIWAFNPETNAWNKQKISLSSILSGGMVNNIFMFSSGDMIYIGMTNGAKRFIKYDPSWDN